jgi:hypothetical protein
MKQTDNYKNVKKLEKKVPIPNNRNYRNQNSSANSSNGTAQGFVAGLSFLGPQVEEFVAHNVDSFKRKFGGNLSEMKSTAARYAKDYPVLTVVGTTAIGMAAGLVWVGLNSSSYQSKKTK